MLEYRTYINTMSYRDNIRRVQVIHILAITAWLGFFSIIAAIPPLKHLQQTVNCGPDNSLSSR